MSNDTDCPVPLPSTSPAGTDLASYLDGYFSGYLDGAERAGKPLVCPPGPPPKRKRKAVR